MPFAICLSESDRTVRTLRWHHSDCTHDCSNSPAKPEENLWIHIFASQIQQAFQLTEAAVHHVCDLSFMAMSSVSVYHCSAHPPPREEGSYTGDVVDEGSC